MAKRKTPKEKVMESIYNVDSTIRLNYSKEDKEARKELFRRAIRHFEYQITLEDED